MGFIGPFLLKQQLRTLGGDKEENPNLNYPKLLKLVTEAVETLFGGDSALEVFNELSHLLPKEEINPDEYPTLDPS